MKILGTGLSGLVGSRVVELFTPRHTCVNFSLENGIDITQREDIIARIEKESDANWVLHLAAYTNVQQAEDDWSLGEESNAWKVNVLATQNIIDACEKSHKRLLYVDTDYVFDGTKKSYSEDDVPLPLSWYAKTKSEGARRAILFGGLVIRIANPYRANPVGKTDFVHKMLERLQTKVEIQAPTDQLFVPTFIDDIAMAIEKLLEENAKGIYHVLGSQALSPFDAAKTLARLYGFDEGMVKPITFSEYFAGRAPVPQYAALTNTKISSLGVRMRGFEEGIAEMKNQEMPR